MIRNLAVRKRLYLGLAVLVAVLISIGAFVPVSAQVVGATLSGTISDSSGAVIPNAEISIKNSATGITRAVSTNNDGLYTAPNLLPGGYVVTASAKGFASVTTNMTLTVGAQQSLNLKLTLGNVSQSVEVTGVAPTVDLTEASLGGLNDETTVQQLPLNGRSWTDLATLQPGVYAIHTQPAATDPGRWNRGFGDQVSISGARPQQNDYRLNGISIDDPTNGGPGSVLGGNTGVDAISEFSVLTANYSAEYGRASGGVINAITKSGTNTFHGDAYEFLRNSALDARNYFDLAQIPPFRRNQFGASAGGPIQKDKTFIFGDYEGLRQYLNISQVDTVPTAAARAGNLSSGAVTVDPQATRFLNAFWPLPNGPIFGDTGFYSFAAPQPTTENYFTVRVDHKLSDKDNLSAVYFLDDSNFITPDEFNNKTTATLVNRQYASLEESHIFSSNAVNDVRVGYDRFVDGAPASATAINSAAADTSLGSLLGESAAAINIAGLTGFSGGLSAAGVQEHFWNSYQFYDDVQVTRGIHSIKFGGGIERDQLNVFDCGGCGGVYTFNSLSDFLTNNPAQVRVQAGLGNTAGIRQSIFGLYIQDDARLRSNLTVNLGLRWEMTTVPAEVNGKITNLRNLTDPLPSLENPLFNNNTTRDFEPRVGFAWDPFHNGKTSVRGGFGIYDQLNPAGFFENSFASTWPLGLVGSGATPPGSFPTGAQDVIGSLQTNPAIRQLQHVDFNPGRSYVMQWNVSVQREIKPNLTALIGYVGDHGVHGVASVDDSDIVRPMPSAVGYLWPCVAPGLPFVPAGTTPPPGLKPGCNGIGTGQRLNPNIGRGQGTFFDNSSLYDGLQLQLTKRISHGFQAQGSFVWSKALDTASGAVVSDTFHNGLPGLLHFIDPRLTKGRADFDEPRVITMNYVWDIPTSNSLTGIEGTALRGWELGGIFTASDGQPFTAILAGDPLGENSGAPVDFPDRLTGPGCGSLINPGNVLNYIKLQCFAVPPAVNVGGTYYLRLGTEGRNIIPGPGFLDFDCSIIKNTYVPRISESLDVQFRAEFFNVLNRSNFQPPVDNSTIFDPSIAGFGIVPTDPTTDIVPGAGAISKTSSTSRQVQFALKIIW